MVNQMTRLGLKKYDENKKIRNILIAKTVTKTKHIGQTIAIENKRERTFIVN